VSKNMENAREFLTQLASEEPRPKYDHEGVAVGIEWKKKKADIRNEGLDCACINLFLFYRITQAQWLELHVARYGDEDGRKRFTAAMPKPQAPSKPEPKPPADPSARDERREPKSFFGNSRRGGFWNRG
jgi:phage terminase large subunit GpA-like protein